VGNAYDFQSTLVLRYFDQVGILTDNAVNHVFGFGLGQYPERGRLAVGRDQYPAAVFEDAQTVGPEPSWWFENRRLVFGTMA